MSRHQLGFQPSGTVSGTWRYLALIVIPDCDLLGARLGQPGSPLGTTKDGSDMGQSWREWMPASVR